MHGQNHIKCTICSHPTRPLFPALTYRLFWIVMNIDLIVVGHILNIYTSYFISYTFESKFITRVRFNLRTVQVRSVEQTFRADGFLFDRVYRQFIHQCRFCVLKMLYTFKTFVSLLSGHASYFVLLAGDYCCCVLTKYTACGQSICLLTRLWFGEPRNRDSNPCMNNRFFSSQSPGQIWDFPSTLFKE